MANITVLGSGVMGSAIAIHLGNNGHQVNLWGTKWDRETIDEMKKTKEHTHLGVKIPETISFYYDDALEEAIKDSKLVIIAVISKGIESISKAISPYITEDQYIMSITKGLHEETLETMSTVIRNALPEDLREKIAIIKLGGPLIDKEVAQGKYTEALFASKDIEAAKYVRDLFKSPKFRGGVSSDIDGVELCAAFKNSYAISMGIIEGIEQESNNPKAALMARGATEMANIVEAFGGSRDTALGIAGVGDYYVTAQGGRNGKFGRFLGQDNNVEQSLEKMNHQTVEGLPITKNGYKLLKKLEEDGKINMKKDTPLFLELYQILYEDKPVHEGIASYWASE